jgi:hypothetical protein
VTNKSAYSLFRATVTVVVMVAAVASLIMVIRAGRHNRSLLLPILFILWVASPFAAVLVANKISRPWTPLTRITLYWLMLIISAGCLVSYTGVLSPTGAKPAFVFLITPFLAWLLIVTVIPMAASISRRKQRSNK